MVKIYHNPQCSKSRAGLEYLKSKGVEFEVVEYLKEPLTEKIMETLLVKLNVNPEEMVRTQEEYFKKNLKGKKFNRHEWIRIILQHPRLLKRPVIEATYKAVWGDPVENIDMVIK